MFHFHEFLLFCIVLQVYKTNRQANVAAPNPLIIDDMTHMCKFVYDFYANKVATLQKLVPTPKPSDPGSNLTITKPDGKTSQHPGDDRDSDDEAEGKKSAVLKEIVNEVAD